MMHYDRFEPGMAVHNAHLLTEFFEIGLLSSTQLVLILQSSGAVLGAIAGYSDTSCLRKNKIH
jgi:hypothetical protein